MNPSARRPVRNRRSGRLLFSPESSSLFSVKLLFLRTDLIPYSPEIRPFLEASWRQSAHIITFSPLLAF